MSSFGENLGEPSWWLSVVFVGIAINLITSLLARGNHAVFSRVSRRWATRTLKKREERAAEIKQIRSDPAALKLLILSQNRNLQLGIFQMIGGLQAVVAALIIENEHPVLSIIMMLLAAFLSIRGLPLLFRSDDQTHIIKSAISLES